MMKISKVLLSLSGGLLIYDAYLMAKGKPNPIKGLPLPCPITISMLGAGLILFSLGSKTPKCDCNEYLFEDDDECLEF